MGAEERNGPGTEIAGRYTPDYELESTVEVLGLIKGDEDHSTTGTSHVSEGMTLLNPSMSAGFTGISSMDIEGYITSLRSIANCTSSHAVPPLPPISPH